MECPEQRGQVSGLEMHRTTSGRAEARPYMSAWTARYRRALRACALRVAEFESDAVRSNL